jgi:hypothetical protein
MPRTSFADYITEWKKLLATVAVNQGDLQHLEEFRAQLEVEMAGAEAANVRQSAALAEAQQATRDLEGFLTRGKDLANRLRTGIRSRYGLRAEKLTEFGMRPLRARRRKPQTPPTQPPEVPGEAEVKAQPPAAPTAEPSTTTTGKEETK